MKLSPELVSFLVALRNVRLLQVRDNAPLSLPYSCFGQYERECAGEAPMKPICDICGKVYIIGRIEWIDDLLRDYPGG